MAESFVERLHDLPRVAVPDWELLEQLEQLLEPYRGGDPFLHAADDRSEYDAGSVDELRAVVETKGRIPRWIKFGFSGPKVDSVVVYTSMTESGGHVYSANEATVDHVVARVRDLFAEAAGRYAPPSVEAPSHAARASWWERHGAQVEKWALAVVPVVLGVLLTAWLIGK